MSTSGRHEIDHHSDIIDVSSLFDRILALIYSVSNGTIIAFFLMNIAFSLDALKYGFPETRLSGNPTAAISKRHV